jgi:NAD(P)H-dependent FMN reductase
LKNALAYPYVAWQRKPVAFVSYSDSTGAGIRAVEQLRNVVTDMQLAQVKSAVHIPLVKTTVGNDATVSDTTIIEKLKLLFEDLAWWTTALKNARG